MRMSPELVIFDCDGVLIDSEIIACDIEARALSHIGYPVSPEEVAERFLGKPANALVETVEAALGHPLPHGFLETLDTALLTAYRERLRPVPGAADAVRRLCVPYCVASSSAPKKLLSGLLAADLVDLFYPHIYSTVLVADGKPAPDLFLLAAQRLAARPERTLVIEDSPAGVEAGRRAGMTVIGFTGGRHCGAGHGEHLTSVGAHAIARNFDELAHTIEALSDPK